MELHEACLVGTTHWATGQVWVSPYDPDTQGFWNECYYCGRMLPFLKKYNHRNIQIIYFCSLIFWPELLLQCKLWSPGYTSMQACCSRRCKNPSLEKEGQKEPWSDFGFCIHLLWLGKWGPDKGYWILAMTYFFQSSLRVIQPLPEGIPVVDTLIYILIS